MRPLFAIVATAMVLTTGCTHTALERRTVKQASTLTDLQYQQVLDNAAMFACNPESLAWHLKLTGGSVQVTDQGTGTFGAGFGAVLTERTGSVFNPTLTAQRGVVGQWNGVPAVDSDDLELLNLGYMKATHPLDEDGKIRQAIFNKVCELSVGYNILLTEETLNKLIDSMKQPTKDNNNPQQFEARKWDLKRRAKELYAELEEQLKTLQTLAAAEKDPVKLETYALDGSNNKRESGRTEVRRQKEAILVVRGATQDRIVNLTRDVCDLPYIPRYPITGRTEHNVHEVDQIQSKIKILMELAEEQKYATPWLCVGKSKKDMPKCACYVGHYRNCGCDCFVWVMPEQRSTLRDFTLAVLTLAPPERQDSGTSSPNGGVIFSPTISGGGR